MTTFTIVGYYPETAETYCDCFDAESWQGAVAQAVDATDVGMEIVAVFSPAVPTRWLVADAQDVHKVVGECPHCGATLPEPQFVPGDEEWQSRCTECSFVVVTEEPRS